MHLNLSVASKHLLFIDTGQDLFPILLFKIILASWLRVCDYIFSPCKDVHFLLTFGELWALILVPGWTIS